MPTELVRTTTVDGLLLDGALHRPADSGDRQLGLDAVLLLHGAGGNFYGSPLLADLAVHLLQQGLHVLRVNTRGHDSVSMVSTRAGLQRQGAAYETVSQCCYDVAAWTQFLVDRGCHQVALLGHSLGALKAVFAATHGAERVPRLVIALSPPRLSYQAFMDGPDRDRFAQIMEAAKTNVDNGNPGALLQSRFPFPLLITSANYVDKYGPQEKYNILRFAPRLPCPTLFVFGEQELVSGDVTFAGLPESLQQLTYDSHVPELITIASADHMYTDAHDALAARILQWMRAHTVGSADRGAP
jgi:pimeloyl-ACP methyl ester carboxylesterase